MKIKENIEISSCWELVSWTNEALKIPEIKKLIEGIRTLAEYFLTSPSYDYTYLNKIIEHWWKEYDIKII